MIATLRSLVSRSTRGSAKSLALGSAAVLGFALSAGADPLEHPYYWDELQIPEAHQITQGTPNIRVAVISTGLNYRLPEFDGAIAINEEERKAPYDGIDNDSNGYVDDVYGANVLTKSGDPQDIPGLALGTFVSSLIAGRTFGVAPGVKLIPIRIYNEGDTGNLRPILESAFDYAVNRGARIIYLGVGVYGDVARELCNDVAALAQKDILVVGGAGNTGNASPDFFPANCGAKNLLLSASTNESSELSDFSSWGFARIHVAAPGEKVVGSDFIGNPLIKRGTHYSAAITAGVAALVWSAHPEYSFYEVKEALIRGSDLNLSLQGKVMSNGRINALKALTARLP